MKNIINTATQVILLAGSGYLWNLAGDQKKFKSIITRTASLLSFGSALISAIYLNEKSKDN